MRGCPYTIRIYVPDGDPEGVRIVDRMNWTGSAIAFPRLKWPEVKQRQEFSRAGIYVLFGYEEKTVDDRPTIYVGKAAREVRNRSTHKKRGDAIWTMQIGHRRLRFRKPKRRVHAPS